MSRIRERIIAATVEELAEVGADIITNADNTRETESRSRNQHDAYVWGVFFKGELKKYGFLDRLSKGVHEGWEKHGIADDTGRGYAEKAIKKYKPQSKGFVLVAMNAIYYSQILEDGAQGRPKVENSRRYRIGSQIYDEMLKLQSRFGSNAPIKLTYLDYQ